MNLHSYCGKIYPLLWWRIKFLCCDHRVNVSKNKKVWFVECNKPLTYFLCTLHILINRRFVRMNNNFETYLVTISKFYMNNDVCRKRSFLKTYVNQLSKRVKTMTTRKQFLYKYIMHYEYEHKIIKGQKCILNEQYAILRYMIRQYTVNENSITFEKMSLNALKIQQLTSSNTTTNN